MEPKHKNHDDVAEECPGCHKKTLQWHTWGGGFYECQNCGLSRFPQYEQYSNEPKREHDDDNLWEGFGKSERGECSLALLIPGLILVICLVVGCGILRACQ